MYYVLTSWQNSQRHNNKQNLILSKYINTLYSNTKYCQQKYIETLSANAKYCQTNSVTLFLQLPHFAIKIYLNSKQQKRQFNMQFNPLTSAGLYIYNHFFTHGKLKQLSKFIYSLQLCVYYIYILKLYLINTTLIYKYNLHIIAEYK